MFGGGSKEKDVNNVYIANLPLNLSEEDVRTQFGQFGNIIGCRVLKDKESQVSRGVGFARFDDPNAASACIAGMNNQMLDGGTKPLQLQLATKSHRPARGETQSGAPSHAAFGGPPAAPSADPWAYYVAPPVPAMGHHHMAPPSAYHQGYEAPGLTPAAGQSSTNLYVQGLPKDYGTAELKVLFAPYGRIMGCRALVDAATNQPRGIGFVRMETPQQAAQAVQALNGSVVMFEEPSLSVSYAKETHRKKGDGEGGEAVNGVGKASTASGAASHRFSPYPV